MCLWFLSLFSMQALDNEIWRIRWDFSFFKRGVSLASRAKEPSCFTMHGKEGNAGWSASTLWFRRLWANPYESSQILQQSNEGTEEGDPQGLCQCKWPQEPLFSSAIMVSLSSFCSECTGRSSKPSPWGKAEQWENGWEQQLLASTQWDQPTSVLDIRVFGCFFP